MQVAQKRILIANSHPTMMNSMRLLLNDRFDVSIMVADVQSLCDAVVNGDYDLVVADLSIPRPSDENIARLLMRLRSDLHLIILSVSDDPVTVDECLSAGAQGVVLKRSAANDLIPAVEAVLRGEKYISPSLHEGDIPWK